MKQEESWNVKDQTRIGEIVPMTKEQLEQLRAQLERERDRLLERRRPSGSWDEELQDIHNADVMDRVDVDKSRDLLLFTESGDKQKWVAVNDALAKIEDGSYGVCEDCGEEIAFPRLEAYPTAELCVNCQRDRELHETTEFKPRPAKPVVLRGESMQDAEEEGEE
jgi:DnaK suppressor protein